MSSGPRPGPALVAVRGPAVQLGDPLHQREPEPEPAARSAPASVALQERLEDASEDAGVDADARVPHADLRRVPSARDRDASPGPRAA